MHTQIAHKVKDICKGMVGFTCFLICKCVFFLSSKNVSGPLIKSSCTHLSDKANLPWYKDFCNLLMFSGSVMCVSDLSVHKDHGLFFLSSFINRLASVFDYVVLILGFERLICWGLNDMHDSQHFTWSLSS